MARRLSAKNVIRKYYLYARTSTSPKALPTLRFVWRHGFTVKEGPFQGLRYPPSALLRVPGLASRLAGAFELELHDTVSEVVGMRPDVIVNIGAAEGYYAAGLALACPYADVIAFEMDQYHTQTFRTLSRHNGLESRIDIRGRCTTSELRSIRPTGLAVVLCDCEGDEGGLVEPQQVEWLEQAVVLVETHDFIVPGITEELLHRLGSSHEVKVIHPQLRYPLDHEVVREVPGLSPLQRELLVSELRLGRQAWIVAWPR